ncbi:MAG TPA: LuxR C-terminal-related transcriptional regulator [Clostridia bacterium]|nr:LuxR C-terminal-related transcriptional regulator [Clostridia bacterium]
MRNTRFLKRARINKILSVIYDYPLTILEAPMGYGKTTAVKSFIKAEGLNPFWFTFPDLSNSEVAFWNKLSDEIIKLDSQAGLALKSLGIPSDAPQTEKVLQLLSDAVSGKSFLMVLDNYQLAKDEKLKKLIMRLTLEELDGLHILLITRDTTDIEFVELLSKGLCHILSRQHLKFSNAEIVDYCRMMLEDITDEDLNIICEYTDGWISFIYITLLGLENGISVGMSTTLEEMVEKALFAPYDRSTQDFLLKLSIMENFTPKQAEHLTGCRAAPLILKRLSKENAFVFYDEKNKTYNIHSVLLDFLRLKQSFSTEEAGALYSRLGDWYLEERKFQRAYGYWNKAGQGERILSHMNNPQNILDELIKFDGADKMFESTPQNILFRYPFAFLLYIFHSMLRGRQSTVMGWAERLDELQRYYEKLDGIDEGCRNRILGETMIVRNFIYFNNFSEMTASDKEIIRLLNGQNSYLMLREYIFTFGSPQYLYLYFRKSGSFEKLSCMLAEYADFAKFANGCGTGSDSLALAEYALETGDFDKVEQNCLQAIAKAETMSQQAIIVCAKFSLIRLRIVQNRLSEALGLLSQLQLDMEKINLPFQNTCLDLLKGYVFASICQPEQIPSWLQIGDITAASFYSQGASYVYLVYGKAVMASKKYMKLEALTGQFKEYFSIYSNQLGFIHNRIFEAAARYGLYGTDAGAAVLEAALNEARADNIVMPFVESSPHIMGMLQLITRDKPGDEYLNRILELCRKYEKTIHGLAYHSVPLTQREIEILSLAAEGLSRKEMAEQLCISEETAKVHLKNIYKKLGTGSKISAIKIAQDRGYLE